ncbi:MAG: hypothetical protein ABIP74_03840 [Candidatus Saccharimonas sp.]
MMYRRLSQAFALPTVLILSLTVLTIVLALLSTVSATHKGVYIDHYQQMADEAAEAGASYASSCLNISNHVQTWGPAASKPNLTQTTDCAGTANAYPSNTYVYSDTKVRTYFVVGDLDYSLSYSSQVSSKGYAEVLKPDGTVSKTYTSIQKMTITWSTDFIGSMSASGTSRTCSIVSGSVYCWGYNAYGQLGNGQYVGPPQNIDTASSVDSLVPVKVVRQAGVMAGKTIVKIFVAQYHSCALSSDGKMYCWGYNASGQLGNNTQTDSAVPVQVGGALAGLTITDIGGTRDTSCAIASGKIYCWGGNSYGSLGINSGVSYVLTPTLVVAGNTGTTLATAYTATMLSTSGSRSSLMCALADALVYCWGHNTIGQVGDGTTTQRNLPTKVVNTGVLSGKTITSISQDGYYTIASGALEHACVVASGGVYCWGDNNDGQLGDNSTVDRTTPVAVVASGVLNGHTVQDVKVGLRHSCARADGAVYCWGFNSSGQVGDSTNTTRTSPVTVTQSSGKLTSSNVISIGAGANRSCAVIDDGRTFCWGLNNNGQIGDGTTSNRNNPTESLFLRPVANKYIF